MGVSSNSEPGRWSGSVVALASATAVAVIASFCSLLAFQTASVEALLRADLDRQRGELELVHVRHSLRRLAMEGVTERLLDETGERVVRLRGVDTVRVDGALGDLVELGGWVGSDAAVLADAVGASGGLDELVRADLDTLLAVADAARSAGRSTSGIAEIDGLRAASDSVLLPYAVVHGALAERLVSTRGDLDALVESNLARLIDAASDVSVDLTAGGHTPVGSPAGDALAVALQRILAGAQLDDRPGTAAADLDVAQTVTRSGDTVSALTAAWTSEAAGVESDLDLSDQEAASRQLRYRIAGFALAAVAAVLLVAGVCSVAWDRRRDRTPAARSEIDAVTGLPTGADLGRRAVPFLSDPRFTEHLVGLVRISELTMIADGYGAAAADRVEAVVARRLRAATDWLTSDRSDAASALVRMRAGEFALTIHAVHHIDVDHVRRVVTLQSGSPIRLGEDHLPVRYGVGLHHQHGATDLDDALDAAETGFVDHARPPGRPRVLLGGPLDLTRGR